MKINLIAVGKIKEKYYTSAIAEYSKRLSRFINFTIIECPEYPPKTQSKADIELSLQQEAKKILDSAKGFIVATDIKGEMLSSENLAELINFKMTQGYSEISFIVGGSNGLANEILNKADCKISFGLVTYPHQLMRVILTEQIYRAFTIIKGLPYHK